jgi:hypothetical protein
VQLAMQERFTHRAGNQVNLFCPPASLCITLWCEKICSIASPVPHLLLRQSPPVLRPPCTA